MTNFHLLYVSSLAPGVGTDVVAKITRVSRPNNLRDGITGLLVFDGESFIQWVEGPQAAIENLLDRLRADARHCEMEVLSLDNSSGPPLFGDWQLAFSFVDNESSSISDCCSLRAQAAIDHFQDMLPKLDTIATS